MSNSLWPHELQRNRPPCPSLSPRVCPSLCPLSRWCSPTISSSAAFFSFCLHQSFLESGFFPVSQLFISGGQSTRASTSVLLMNTQDWSPLEWTGWISLLSKGLSRVFSSTTIQKHQFFSAQPGFPGGSTGKESTCTAGELGSCLDWEDPLEKGKVTHSSILGWRTPWTIPWDHKESAMTERLSLSRK